MSPVRHEPELWDVFDAELADTLELVRPRHRRTYERRLARRQEAQTVTHTPTNARARVLEVGAGRLENVVEQLASNEHVFELDTELAAAAATLSSIAADRRDAWREAARRLRTEAVS